MKTYSSPLVGSVTTCLSGTPSVPTLSNETTNSIQVSLTPFTGATTYRLDVSTNNSFSSYVTGYQDLVVNGTSYVITGLSPNTLYYVRIRAHNESCPSSNSNAASRTTLKIEPSNQPTNFAASSASTNSISLSWTAAVAGSQLPDGYLIKGSATSLSAISDPVDGTDPGTGSLALSSGVASYKTSSSSATFTGHTAGTMYFYKIYSYTNASTGIDFKTNNVPNLYQATQPNNSGTPVFTSTPLNAGQATITWVQPSGFDAAKHKILVFVKSGSTAISTATLNTNPTSFNANTTFGSGSPHSSDAVAYCVYNGDGTSVTISGLTGNTTYQVRILVGMLEVNSNSTYTYSSGVTTSGTTFKTEPSNQPTNFVAGTVTTSNIPLSWTAAAGSQLPDGYLIKGSATSLEAISDPVDGIDSTNDTSFSDGIAIVKTTTNPYSSFANQTAGTMYYYKIYSYTNTTTSSTTSTTIDYKTDNVPNLYHATLPAVNIAPVFSATTSNATTISWSQPVSYSNSNHSTLVFIKAVSAVTFGTPTSSPSSYSANATFALGTTYQNDISAYCIYKGDLTNVTVHGLDGNTNYHVLIVTVVDATNSNGKNSYSTTLTSNKTTLCNAVDTFNLDFEGTTSLPQCTSFLSSDNLGANINNEPYGGLKSLGLQNSTTFILPFVTNAHLNTHYINFYARTLLNVTGQIGFGYLTNPSDATTYVNLETFDLNSTYKLCTYTPTNIPENAYIAIKLLTSSVLRIDNIVWEPKPSVIWSSQTWSNTTGPTSSDNADIDDDLTTTSDLNCKDLTINSGKTLTIASGHSLNITGNLVNNGQIIFKSDATSTGRFDSYTGNAITGSGTVTIERYIDGKRAYRLLAPGLTTTGTIANNWQQQVFITGSTTGANGFDATTTGNPSMYTYENSGWAPISNTNVLTLDATKGYRMLIRGDRTPSLLTSPSEANMNTAVTLTATGSLVTGDVIFTTLPSQDYTLVGNPYVSPIDWATVTKNDIAPTYYVWDPNLGTVGQRGRYVSCDEAGLTSIVSGSGGPSSAVNTFIQPGQAFFIEKAVSGTPGSITVKETDKAATFTDVFRTNSAPTTTTIEGKLGMNLYESLAYSLGDYPIDGAVAVSGTVFNTASANDDAKKLMSHGEQVAFVRENKQLGVEKVSPPQLNDVLTLATLNLVPNKNYVWSVVLQDNFSNENSYLYDAFTQTYHSLTASSTTVVSFATSADVASTQVNRFKIVFQTSVLSAPDFTNEIVVYPNPAKVQNAVCYVKGISNATVALHNVLGQNIPIQTTTDGTTLTLRPTVALNKGIYVVHIAQDGTIKQVKWIVD